MNIFDDLNYKIKSGYCILCDKPSLNARYMGYSKDLILCQSHYDDNKHNTIRRCEYNSNQKKLLLVTSSSRITLFLKHNKYYGKMFVNFKTINLKNADLENINSIDELIEFLISVEMFS